MEQRVIVGVENLKDEFRKYKLKTGDLKGLKNKFALSERLGIPALSTFFYLAGGNGKKKPEVYADIQAKSWTNSFWVYSMKELIEEIESVEDNEFEIQLCLAMWNEHRTDADRSNLTQPFIFKKVTDNL